EVFILIILANDSNKLTDVFEETATLIYIFFIGFLGINQSNFLLQVRFYQASHQAGKEELTDNGSLLLSEDEKQELKRLFEMILKEKKLYLDPNLKLET